MKEKNSVISLLKLVAVILIIMSHITPDFVNSNSLAYVNSNLATSNIQEFYVIFSKYLGQLGVCIFIACSTYFLVERDSIRSIKVITIELDAILIGIITLVLYSIIRRTFAFCYLRTVFMPMTFSSNWFIGCYIIYYLSVPYLNDMLKNKGKYSAFKISLFVIIFYSILQMIFKDHYYSNHLIGFYCIHIMMYYYKNYMKRAVNTKINCVIVVVSSLILIFGIWTYNLIAVKTGAFIDKMQHFRMFMNPLMIIIAFSLIGVSQKNRFHNVILDKIAELTFFVYVIHENDIIKNTFRADYFIYAYERFSYKYLILICIFGVCCTFLISILLAYLYKNTLHRFVLNRSDEIYKIIKKTVFRLMTTLDNIL